MFKKFIYLKDRINDSFGRVGEYRGVYIINRNV